MKLFVIILFSVVLAVSSETEKSKTKTVKEDQKIDNSAFLQKFLPPLNHDVNQRYGQGQEYRNENWANRGNGYYDYNDEEEQNEGIRRNQGWPLYNVPNIWGYSKNGAELGKLVSHSYNNDNTVWGYLRDGEGRLRNEGRDNAREYLRNEGRPRYLARGHLPKLNVPLEPEYIGYVGYVDPRGHGYKDRYHYRLIGRTGLGFDKRTAAAYGLRAPITPSLLKVVGQYDYRRKNQNGYNSRGYSSQH
ncbi:uncharacterized protein LOC112048635 [Bicyclus anynana]|uniref:Uncharacterized protein LOC112048635 n=1 Tax=Bicyclus anynana TaxID=110368 RepID=A0A6J1N5A3_BICAN|nr:uncharacterized protein LOC112048635 [Bicyclus anynana]